MVPLTPSVTTIDLLAQQQWPVVLVTTPRLGSINHTLLSLAAIDQRDVPLAAVIFNCHFEAHPSIVADTRCVIDAALKAMGSSAPVVDLPAQIGVGQEISWEPAGLDALL